MTNSFERLANSLDRITYGLEEKSSASAKKIVDAITGPRDPEAIGFTVGAIVLILAACNPITRGTKPKLDNVSQEAKDLAEQGTKITNTPWWQSLPNTP